MSDDILTRKPPPYDLRLKYGADQYQFGDLRLPKSAGPHPLAVNIHGGFWRAKYDLQHAGHICAALSSSGIATFNLEYRRVGNAGGGWPGSFEDVSNGLRFIQQHAAEHHIDAKRTVVMGHSAGGQLAICLAHRVPELRGVVSLAGVLDLYRAYDLHLSNDAVVEFLGGTPNQVPEHYREASPMDVPVPHVKQLIVCGSQDDVVPPDFSRDYEQAKSKRGENAELLALAGADHFDLIDPRSKTWGPIANAMQKLVR